VIRRSVGWTALLLMLIYGAAAKDANARGAEFRDVTEAKVTALSANDPKFVSVIDVSVNKKLDRSCAYGVGSGLIEYVRFIISQTSVSEILSYTRSDLNGCKFKDWSVRQRGDQFGFNVDAGTRNFRSAFTVIPDFVAHHKLLIRDQSFSKLEVLDEKRGSFALNKSPSLYTSNNGEYGGKETYYSRPMNHSGVKLAWFFILCAFIASIVGVWSFVFRDGLGICRYLIGSLGWAMMFVFLSRALFFHSQPMVLNFLQSYPVQFQCCNASKKECGRECAPRQLIGY
jgi:hypothetical protein